MKLRGAIKLAAGFVLWTICIVPAFGFARPPASIFDYACILGISVFTYFWVAIAVWCVSLVVTSLFATVRKQNNRMK